MLRKERGRVSRFSIETFWSHSTITFRRRTFLCSGNLLVSKNFIVTKEGRLSRFSVEISLSHRTKAVPRGKFLRFNIFLLSEKSNDKRGSGYRDFPWKLFCLIVSNDYVDFPFCVSKIYVSQSVETFRRGTLLSSKNFLVTKTIRDKREGECHDFSVETFWSHCTITFRRATFLCFRKIWCRKTSELWGRGAYHNFPSKRLCLTEPKHFLKEVFVFHYFSVIEKNNNKRGGGYDGFP